MKRVPTHTPSAPSTRAAAPPRPSTMPPAATTGTRPATASTTCGTRGRVATRPVCPPASVPWAITRSHPASTAATAWRTFPHMLATSTPCAWQCSIASQGMPSPATNTDAPSRTSAATSSSSRSGMAVSRSTPNGRVVRSRTARISSTIWGDDIVEAPRQPNPPASETAATSAW